MVWSGRLARAVRARDLASLLAREGAEGSVWLGFACLPGGAD